MVAEEDSSRPLGVMLNEERLLVVTKPTLVPLEAVSAVNSVCPTAITMALKALTLIPLKAAPDAQPRTNLSAPNSATRLQRLPTTISQRIIKFTGSIQSYGNEAAIQSAIMTAGPVETAFTVYQDFENYVSGVYKKTSSTVLGGHAVRIVGWGVDGTTKYWKVANSWNPFWGEQGYFRIVRGVDECGIESQGMANGAGSWVGPTIF
jgi:hypothetical protein